MTNTVSSAIPLQSATASSSTPAAPTTIPGVTPMADRGILPEFSSDERTAAAAAAEPSVSKQRKKRRWDQPDESLITSGVVTPGMLSMSTVEFPTMPTFSVLSSSSMHANVQAPLMQLQNAVMVQKINQPKIQEDLVIAREIVINDADPAMRYKLTKRQTQEEIQKCTGAVVITRGKYRPPNAVSDGEKPLYLHISSGAHLKETPERILAVDHAAAMVEDMLKQVMQPLSTCVYVGFDADPSLNIAARIRGPNDQYINHIINETGATVVLRGNGSGYLASAESEGPQLMHLFLSSNNQKSLEDARLLAENLLDTISRECGTTRVSSTKLYGAVPPPQQLLVGVPSSGLEMSSNLSTSNTLACSAAIPVVGTSISSVVAPEVTAAFPLGQVAQTGGLISPGCSQTNKFLYSQPISTACSSYSAYAGIYPQATPLQQVALALKQCSTMSSIVVPTTSGFGTAQQSYANTEKRPPQRRKFQESPTTFTALAESHQVSAEKKLDTALPVTTLKNQQPLASSHTSTSCASSKSMPPPPPKFPSLTPISTSGSMLPPKSTSSSSVNGASEMNNNSNTPNLISVPDTLVKLMEYGDDDEEDDDDVAPDKNELDPSTNHPNRIAAMKPFWAA